jgi:ubiquinone/menaquinone biosynthesis C-methylase UbiE
MNDENRNSHRTKPGLVKDDAYIPPLKFGWLTPAYDFILRITMRESTFKQQLVHQAGIEKGFQVLDLGCGTGTLTILIKSTHPGAGVIGLDADARALDIAAAKIRKAGLDISLVKGMAYELPFADASFDRVLSSLMFHHLEQDDKRRTFSEVFRVLRPGGEFHLADFGPPRNPAMYLVSKILSLFERVDDNIRGLLPGMMGEAGFEEVMETTSFLTAFGTLRLYRARKLGARS